MTRIMMKKPGFRHIPRAHSHMQNQACMNRHIATNILKGENGYEIQLAVPGINKKDLNIYVKNEVLHIESKSEITENTDNFKLKQFDYSNFSKRFELSDKIDTSAIDANYEEGILRIKLALKDKSETEIVKKIDIK